VEFAISDLTGVVSKDHHPEKAFGSQTVTGFLSTAQVCGFVRKTVA
jgi:hypothetical protein